GWPRTSTRKRRSCAWARAPASRASRWIGSRRCGVTSRSAAAAAAAAALLLLAGCGHRAPPPGQAANPIAAVALPRTNPEAQREFDEGLRVMKLGRKHYKEARPHLEKATALDG